MSAGNDAIAPISALEAPNLSTNGPLKAKAPLAKPTGMISTQRKKRLRSVGVYPLNSVQRSLICTGSRRSENNTERDAITNLSVKMWP